jgi:hypothetical protein
LPQYIKSMSSKYNWNTNNIELNFFCRTNTKKPVAPKGVPFVPESYVKKQQRDE